MGNIFGEQLKLYIYKWTPPGLNQIYVHLDDLNDLPSPLNGKIVIPFSLIHQKRDFVNRNHHQVLLMNNCPQIENSLCYQFKGIPIIKQSQLIKNPESCLQKHFDDQHCPIPLILQRFNESLLKNYINAFLHSGINIEYYDRLQNFLRSECSNNLLLCSHIQLEQLSHRIQNMTYKRQTDKKMTILCFCNKDEYSFPRRTQEAMQSNNIEVHLCQNMLQIIERVKTNMLSSPLGSVVKAQKVLFYLDQKQKQVNYLLKMAKKIEKSVRNVKVAKVLNRHRLIQKIKESVYSIVIFSDDSKEMKAHIDIYEALQTEGIEDRAIFIRRDSQLSSNVMQKIQNTITRPKYLKCELIDKPLVFYGTLDGFKYVLSHFPRLTFKKFVDTKDRQAILHFLRLKTEIVVTHLRVCGCTQQWGFIECKMIHIQMQRASSKVINKEPKPVCSQETWFLNQQDLLDNYEMNKEELLNLNCNFGYKKMYTIGHIINETFCKLKQKKTLLINEMFGSVFLFSCQYYFLDQISSFIIKYFTSKQLGNFQKNCLFQHLKFRLYRELVLLFKTANIEEEVLEEMQKDDSEDVFELSDKIIELAFTYPYFLQEINSIWELFLYQDRAQYLQNCQVLLFLMLLSFNKTSFTQFHNETLQNITLKVKPGLVTFQDDTLSTFIAKTRNSFVYNISFLACQVVKPGSIPGDADILIKLEGSQLNNFCFSLPLWRKGSNIMIAPLTKFQIFSKRNSLTLKLSLNSQQKMIEKFNQHFLEDKAGMKLFQQEREVRSLDSFLESMCRGKFQTAGYIIKKMRKQQKYQNQQLLNAYIILHHLKCGDVEEAIARLKHGKYYQILSKVIASCREGSSIEAAHSEFTGDANVSTNQENRSSLDNISTLEEDRLRNSTNQSKPKYQRAEKRSPSALLKRESSQNRNKGKRIPVPVRHFEKRRHGETSVFGGTKRDIQEEEEVKIHVFSPTNKTISCEMQNNSEIKRNTASFNSNFLLQNTNIKSQSIVKQIVQCQLSRINSYGSSNSVVTDFFPFEDPVNESLEEQSPIFRRESRKKKSKFLEIQQDRVKLDSQSEQIQPGTGSGTGNFNFTTHGTKQEEFVFEELEQQKQGIMTPVVEEQQQKLSQSEDQSQCSLTGNEYFMFSLGKNGEKVFGNRKRENKLPRNSIESRQSVQLNALTLKLGKIDQQSASCHNISKSNILASSASDKQNDQPGTAKRSEGHKHFTFCKTGQPVKPRHSGRNQVMKAPSSSLLISQDSSIQKTEQVRKGQVKRSSLFMMFGEDEKQSISFNSIVQIDFDDEENRTMEGQAVN